MSTMSRDHLCIFHY